MVELSHSRGLLRTLELSAQLAYNWYLGCYIAGITLYFRNVVIFREVLNLVSARLQLVFWDVVHIYI